MSHANAALTPRHRLKVAQLVVDQGWSISEVATRFQVVGRRSSGGLTATSPAGSTSTTTTGPTPLAATSHPSHD